jgi:hypothetical protein
MSAALVLASSVCANDGPIGPQTEVPKLLLAITADDYAAFIANGTASFKGLKKDQFESVVSQIGSNLKSGYDLSYLGDLNQQGYQVTLWRIRFKSGSDDLIATLSMKDGKVGGFWIK